MPFLLVYTVVDVFIAVVTVAGNSVILAAFLKDRRLRKLTNYYLVSLAVADLLVAVIVVPTAIVTKQGLARVTFVPCLAMLSVILVVCTVSILHLVAVSLDRYWAVLHPFSYIRVTSGRTVGLTIAVCWLLGLLLGFLPLLIWRRDPSENEGCSFSYLLSLDFQLFRLLMAIASPALLMAFFYGRIHWALRCQTQRTCSIQESTDKTDAWCTRLRCTCREARKAMRLFVIVVFFVVCWLPLYVLKCVAVTCDGCTPPSWLFDCFVLMAHLNSACNPFLYAYSLSDFRVVVASLFGMTYKQKKRALSVLSRGTEVECPVVTDNSADTRQ